MIFNLQDLEEKSKSRPQGYKEEILASAKQISKGLYELDDETFKVLAEKYRVPQIKEKLKNFFESMKDLADDPTMRNKEEVIANLEICQVCPYLIQDGLKCGVCGCYLKAKVQFKVFKCPIKKWSN